MTTSTQCDGEPEEAVPDAASVETLNAEARPARTRAKAIVAALTERFRPLPRHWMRQGKATWDKLWDAPLAEQQPASPRELRGYIHSAAWVPGEVPVLEFIGRLYGYLVALPVSLVLYTIAWLLQRPARALVTALIAVIVWFTAT